MTMDFATRMLIVLLSFLSEVMISKVDKLKGSKLLYQTVFFAFKVLYMFVDGQSVSLNKRAMRPCIAHLSIQAKVKHLTLKSE